MHSQSTQMPDGVPGYILILDADELELMQALFRRLRSEHQPPADRRQLFVNQLRSLKLEGRFVNVLSRALLEDPTCCTHPDGQPMTFAEWRQALLESWERWGEDAPEHCPAWRIPHLGPVGAHRLLAALRQWKAVGEV